MRSPGTRQEVAPDTQAFMLVQTSRSRDTLMGETDLDREIGQAHGCSSRSFEQLPEMQP